MSTYVLMKILESAPSRYDRGIRILTFGKLDRAYDRLTSYVRSGQKVLDIGCGTGALTLRLARKGAFVKGIDISPQMLEIAIGRVEGANLWKNVELYEMGVAELGDEDSEKYDVVTSGLCFSELAEDELIYCLKETRRILKPQGLLLVADEVKPGGILKKIVNQVLRVPVALITYLLTQTATIAVAELPERIIEAGFEIEEMRLNTMENFIELVAKKA